MDKSFYKLAALIVFLTIVDEVYQVKVLDYEMIFFLQINVIQIYVYRYIHAY